MDGPVADLVRFEAERARAWYGVGMGLLPMLDWRSAACTGAMAGIYRRLLEHIAARPQQALAARMSLPGREKAMIAAAALSGFSTRRFSTRRFSRPVPEAQPSKAQP
jgi:phytoene synthase